ncbi:MAG: hypothetical protein HXX19_08165 [Rhodoferax sp.]|nr:hypothetical protein [Rhodoferax sp.]
MNKPLVRKFQMPPAPAATAQAGVPNLDQAAAPQAEAPPTTDFDIPEINTNFMDNLFADPRFADRFDVAYDQTVAMGLDGEAKPPAAQPDPASAQQEWPDMLDMSFTKAPGKS